MMSNEQLADIQERANSGRGIYRDDVNALIAEIRRLQLKSAPKRRKDKGDE